MPCPSDAISQVCYRSNNVLPSTEGILQIMDRESTIKLLQKGKACSRFLIISYWPITYHVVKMVIRRFGLDSGVIIAADSTGDRAAVAEFNNSKAKYQVINTTYLCGETGLNLHEYCKIVILMKPRPNSTWKRRQLVVYTGSGSLSPSWHTDCYRITG